MQYLNKGTTTLVVGGADSRTSVVNDFSAYQQSGTNDGHVWGFNKNRVKIVDLNGVDVQSFNPAAILKDTAGYNASSAFGGIFSVMGTSNEKTGVDVLKGVDGRTTMRPNDVIKMWEHKGVADGSLRIVAQIPGQEARLVVALPMTGGRTGTTLYLLQINEGSTEYTTPLNHIELPDVRFKDIDVVAANISDTFVCIVVACGVADVSAVCTNIGNGAFSVVKLAPPSAGVDLDACVVRAAVVASISDPKVLVQVYPEFHKCHVEYVVPIVDLELLSDLAITGEVVKHSDAVLGVYAAQHALHMAVQRGSEIVKEYKLCGDENEYLEAVCDAVEAEGDAGEAEDEDEFVDA
jgi:hypothetical protein